MKKVLCSLCLITSLYLMMTSVLWFGLRAAESNIAIAVAGSNTMAAMYEADAYALLFLLIGFGLGWSSFILQYPGQSLWQFTLKFWTQWIRS